MLMQKRADELRSDFYIISAMILCGANSSVGWVIKLVFTAWVEVALMSL